MTNSMMVTAGLTFSSRDATPSCRFYVIQVLPSVRCFCVNPFKMHILGVGSCERSTKHSLLEMDADCDIFKECYIHIYQSNGKVLLYKEQTNSFQFPTFFVNHRDKHIEIPTGNVISVHHNTVLVAASHSMLFTNSGTNQKRDYPTFIIKRVETNVSANETLQIFRSFDVFQDILLGKGGNGEVFLGVERATGRPVAIKRENKEMLGAEFEFLVRSRHPNNVEPIGYFCSQGEHDYIVMEFLSGGTLRHLQKTKYSKGFPPHVVKRYMFEILSGLAHMHKQGIMHRDIKTSNLMLAKKNDEQDHFFVKIVDFGNGHDLFNNLPTQNLTTCFSCAPELIQNDLNYTYNEKVDMWAVGTVFYELLTGKRLFDGSKLHEVARLLSVFCTNDLDAKFKRRSKQALHLLKACLRKNPDERISAIEALHHPYFRPYHRNVEGNTAFSLPSRNLRSLNHFFSFNESFSEAAVSCTHAQVSDMEGSTQNTLLESIYGLPSDGSSGGYTESILRNNADTNQESLILTDKKSGARLIKKNVVGFSVSIDGDGGSGTVKLSPRQKTIMSTKNNFSFAKRDVFMKHHEEENASSTNFYNVRNSGLLINKNKMETVFSCCKPPYCIGQLNIDEEDSYILRSNTAQLAKSHSTAGAYKFTNCLNNCEQNGIRSIATAESYLMNNSTLKQYVRAGANPSAASSLFLHKDTLSLANVLLKNSVNDPVVNLLSNCAQPDKNNIVFNNSKIGHYFITPELQRSYEFLDFKRKKLFQDLAVII